MACSHERGQQGWPWAYQAEQVVTLAPQSLTLEMRVTNTDKVDMPCGMGFHPYFPARFTHRIGFKAEPSGRPMRNSSARRRTRVRGRRLRHAARPRRCRMTQYYGAWHGEASLASADGPAITLRPTPHCATSCCTGPGPWLLLRGAGVPCRRCRQPVCGAR
jgi:aldose 1-epimerase